jgi:putative transposon-encoded protein
VQGLLTYEKTHAKRDDVITMYERRLTKIGNEGS